MAKGNKDPVSRPFLEAIEKAEESLSKNSAFIKNLKAKLVRAKRALSSKPGTSALVSALIADLRSLPAQPNSASPTTLADTLKRHLADLRRKMKVSFASDLERACRAVHLPCKPLPDGFSVGPFGLRVDQSKEEALLQFAKLVIVKNIPLIPDRIVEVVVHEKKALLDAPVDVASFTANLEEAIRVSLARQRKTPRTELRVELPLAYREMCFIYKIRSRTRRHVDYPLSRFVVELATLVQSDQNIRGATHFRLEPAVIENTKNPKKSVFVPRVLSAGYGEGTYYQAVMLRQS